jgi:antitoxin Phd
MLASWRYVTTCGYNYGAVMRTLGLRDAKASLSAVIEAAERGEATIITKHGRPAAVVVPMEQAKRIYPADRPSFVSLLMRIPHPLETEHDASPLREADL